MSTLAHVKFSTKDTVSTYVDSTTPAGHFAAAVKVLGIHTTFLMEGKIDDPNAVIKGRIEAKGMGAAIRIYKGGSMKGGTWFGRFESTEKAFASMV